MTNAQSLASVLTSLGGTPAIGDTNADVLAKIVTALGGTPSGGTNATLIAQIAEVADDATEKPSGNKSITANGTNIDVAAYATVSVAVPVPELCVVQFDLGTGTGTVAPMACAVGEQYDLPDGTGVTPPSQKVFAGWSTTDGGTAIEGKYTAATSTLYAVYGDA